MGTADFMSLAMWLCVLANTGLFLTLVYLNTRAMLRVRLSRELLEASLKMHDAYMKGLPDDIKDQLAATPPVH